MASSPNVLNAIFLASRPKTWIAGISPVLIGAALALKKTPLSPSLFFASLFFSLFIQIGTNFANDYFDFVNGVDNDKRIGPARAVAKGWLPPETMFRSALVLFAAAFAVSIPLMMACGIWSFVFVASSIAFGVLYTGGKKPLGYIGLGDILVLAYFGPVAVLGTYFVQFRALSFDIGMLSLAPGLLSAAILVANNLRDEWTDRDAGKRTLVVRFGRRFGRVEYAVALAAASSIPLFFGYYFSLFTLAASVPLIRKARSYSHPKEIVGLLPQTALLLIVFTFGFCCESLR